MATKKPAKVKGAQAAPKRMVMPVLLVPDPIRQDVQKLMRDMQKRAEFFLTCDHLDPDAVREAHTLVKRCGLALRAIQTADPESAAFAAMNALDSAWRASIYQSAMPEIRRDRKLQESKPRPRGSRMPLLDAWLTSAGLENPAKVLWRSLPTDTDANLYLDGELVYEDIGRKELHSIGFSGFQSRLSALNRKAKNSRS